MTRVYGFNDEGLDVIELKDKTRVVISYGDKYREGMGMYLPINKYWPAFEKQLWDGEDSLGIWFKPEEVNELIAGLRLIRDKYDTSRDK